MLIINGDFLCRNLTGIERFSIETCKCLDKICKKSEISIYIPKNAVNPFEFENISVIVSEKKCNSFPVWEHFIFSNYVRKNKAVSLDFSNMTPLFHPGIAFLHDIYARIYANDFHSFKDKLRKFYMCLMYRHVAKKASFIFTVSEFSKKQISSIYKINENQIGVIPNGWEHFDKISPDENIFKKFPVLSKSNYFFTLGSLQKRKNLKWILENAKHYPENIYAISGKAISGMVSNELEELKSLKNVVLLGYVKDEEVKALMKNCKAFVFPSYYEGFGIPPLEALSTGAKIIISNTASLPEIFDSAAAYISPDDYSTDLNSLLLKPTENSAKILEKYTYKNAALILYEYLKKIL